MTAGELQGRTGLVTGGARGIGAAVSAAIAGRGGRVGVVDRDATAAEEHAAALRAAGGSAIGIVGDVSRFDDIESARERLESEFGPSDFVVANAGIGDFSLVSDGDPETWRRVVEINLLGVAFTVRAVLPGMKQRGFGDVVLMASIAGRNAWVGEPIYIATKWAVVGLGQSLRREAGGDGVRVTLLEPGTVDTPLVRSTQEGRDELDRFPSLRADDVGDAVAWTLGRPRHLQISELEIRAVGPDIAG